MDVNVNVRRQRVTEIFLVSASTASDEFVMMCVGEGCLVWYGIVEFNIPLDTV